jgi:hypothetical protein
MARHQMRRRYQAESADQRRTDQLVHRVTVIVAIGAVGLVLVALYVLLGLR